MGRRRQAREIALQALYVMDTAGTDPREAFALVNRRDDPGDENTLDFALSLVSGVCASKPVLDRHIKATAENWSLSRMAAVDRNLLRLAAYELLYTPATPVNVVIDEAIEIARKFSTEDSTRFINGILDKIQEKRPPAQGDPDPPASPPSA